MRDPRGSRWYDAVRPLVEWLGIMLATLRRVADVAEGSRLQRRIQREAKRCGTGLRVNGSGHFTGAANLEIGDNVHIGADAYFRCEAGLAIGDNTHMSRRVTIYTINHDYHGARLPYDDTTRDRPVHIGRNVWIAMGVTILPGTTIGEGAIIGAGAVVGGEVAPLTIIGAPLATPVATRDEQHYRDRDEQRAYGGVNGRPLD